jgi:hypothetical protein
VLHQCSDFFVTGHSYPNFLAFNLDAELSDGGIPQGPETITFDPLVSVVVINAGHPLAGTITMECFDLQGSLVGSDSITPELELQPLSVSAPVIQRCVLSFVGTPISPIVAVFDDLQFQPIDTDVPATSRWALLALVCLILAASTVVVWFRRRLIDDEES